MNVTFGCCRLQPSSERVQPSGCGLACILDRAVRSLTSCSVFTHGAAGVMWRGAAWVTPPGLLLTPSLSVLPAQQDGFTDVKSDTLKYGVATDEPWNTPHTHTHTLLGACVCKVDSAVDGKWWLRSFAPQNRPPCQKCRNSLFWRILSVKRAHAAHMEKLCNARRATPVSYERESHFKKACGARRIIRCKIPENRQMSNWKCGMLSKAASAKWAFMVRLFRL